MGMDEWRKLKKYLNSATIKQMVEKLLNLPKKPHPDDVADALAVAICTTHCCNNLLWRNKL